jgi:hypothetical protein
MSELEPADEKMMVHYRANTAVFDRFADLRKLPKFSDQCRKNLSRFLHEKEKIDLIESVTRVGQFNDVLAHKKERQAVSKLLRLESGRRLPRGKRTRPGMLEFVAQITPILLYYGVPCKTSETSRLTEALRAIADDINLQGDPRDELRRLARLKANLSRQTRARLYGTLSDAISPSPRVAPHATK